MPDPFDLDHISDEDGFDDLAALRAIGRGTSPEADWESPPDGLWARIEAEALGASGHEAELAGPPTGILSDDAPSSTADLPRSGRGPGVAHDDPVAPVVPITTRRRPPWMLAAAAVAAAVVLVVGLVVANSDTTDEPELIASVDLEVLAGGGSGRADLVDADGVRQIRLETADLEAEDGFLEVWMIDPTVSRLVSLGPLRPDGVYDLPAGVDPADFPIVDISVEPVDGDPTHSGNSLLRGQLTI